MQHDWQVPAPLNPFLPLTMPHHADIAAQVNDLRACAVWTQSRQEEDVRGAPLCMGYGHTSD